MNNILRVTLIIISSVLLVFFCYKLYLNLTLIEKPGFYDFERSNIQEKIVGDKKILTEKNLEVKMAIPKDWEYKKYYDGINFFDPNINVDNVLKHFKDWSQGCFITYSTDKGQDNYFTQYDSNLNDLMVVKEGDKSFCPKDDDCEVISIRGLEGLKSARKFEGLDNFDGYLEDVYITILDTKNKRVHIIETFLSTQVPECQEHLNDFINSLEFK